MIKFTYILTVCLLLFSINQNASATTIGFKSNTLVNNNPIPKSKNRQSVNDIILTKDITFKKYTLEDKYVYENKKREFQWEKIKKNLAYINSFQKEDKYALISNYKNKNGIAPLVANYKKNKYQNISDSLGTERQQSVPLYKRGITNTPTIYGRDGSLVKLISSDTLPMVTIKGITNFEGDWDIPNKYISPLPDDFAINHVIVVDVTNQNICVLERSTDSEWKIKSMNPATTGKSAPPYSRKTPLGIFLVQEQKSKMYYNKDGTNTLEGFAPWANRFTNGAYIHGVPTNNPKGQIREYSSTLGTVALSHMCVRNPSSHSKFIFDLIKPLSSIVIVID